MELVSVTITAQAITSRYGTLMPGDVLRTDAAYARHLVEECGAARFDQAAKTEDAPAKKARAPKTKAAEPAEPAGPAESATDTATE